MSEIKLIDAYPGVLRILLAVDYANGRVNREEPVDERLVIIEDFLIKETLLPGFLPELNTVGRKLSFHELQELTDGAEEDMKEILKFCPKGTDEFLNRYFDEK